MSPAAAVVANWVTESIVFILQLAAVLLVGLLAAVVVGGAAWITLNIAVDGVEKTKTTVVPAVLALIGALAVPAAEKAAAGWSAAVAWGISVVVAVLTFIGAVLATKAHERTAVLWSGLSVLILPVVVLAAAAILTYPTWWHTFSEWSALDRLIVAAGLAIYLVAISTGAWMIVAERRQQRRAST